MPNVNKQTYKSSYTVELLVNIATKYTHQEFETDTVPLADCAQIVFHTLLFDAPPASVTVNKEKSAPSRPALR